MRSPLTVESSRIVNVGGAKSKYGALTTKEGSTIHGYAPASSWRKFVAMRSGSGSRPEAGYTTHCDLPASASCTYSRLTCSGAFAENTGATMAANAATTVAAAAMEGTATTDSFRGRRASAH